MLTIEVHGLDFKDFINCLKSSIIEYSEEEKHLKVYSWNWSGDAKEGKEVFCLILSHFYERLGDIAKVKKAAKRKQLGLEMRGIDINVLTDDMDLFSKRVNEMFNGQTKSYV